LFYLNSLERQSADLNQNNSLQMMIRLTAISFILLTLSFNSYAQDEAETTDEATSNWTRTGVIGLNFSQTYLDNWQGGGQSSFNGTALFNYTFNYKKDKVTWDNSIDAAYGLTRLGEAGVFQKTDDRFEFNSKLGRTTPVINTSWAAMFTFRTQWDAGYDFGQTPSPLISDPFSPAYIIAGIGIDYKPSDAFSAYVSPVTNKTTIVDNVRLSAAGAFGVEPGETIRAEIGGFVKFQYQKELVKNVKLTSKLDLFSNYLNNPQNIDVNWETLIAMKINDFLSASITTHLIYDDDIRFDVDRNDDGIVDGAGPRTQFKEVFALGVQYQIK